MTRTSLALALALALPLTLPIEGHGQPLTLDECIEKAYEHLAYEQQADTYRRSSALAVRNAGKDWLPGVTLDGSYSYQNENTRIAGGSSIPGLELPGAPLNFSRLLVNFTQTVYDGSAIAGRRNLERSRYTILEKQLAVEKVQTKSRVISLYMSIQLTDDRLSIVRNRKKVIAGRSVTLAKAAGFGGATTADVKTLAAELLTIDQEIIELQYTRTTLLASLGEMIGRTLGETRQLRRPDPPFALNRNVDARPEIQLLHAKIENLDSQKAIVRSSRRPTLSAFATLGAGNPGYNIFDDQPAPMGMVGARLQWRIFDWNRAGNETKILTAGQDAARYDQYRVRVRLLTELKAQEREIEMMNALLAKDEELIRLRADIAAIKAAALENGTITSTDYISELNREEEARLNQRVHELRLILAKLNYMTLQGDN